MKLYDLLLLMEREYRGQISLEPILPVFWKHPRLQLDARMNFHNLEYCRFVKRQDANLSCANNKHRSMHIASRGHRFCGTCPYGMWELAQPVMFRGKLAAILYFGGFCRKDRLAQPVDGTTFTGKLPPEITPQKIEQIKKLASFAADFIRWELTSLETEGNPPEKQHATELYLQTLKLYFARHYREQISIVNAAKTCNLTPNYLGDILKKTTGLTFRQLLTQYRLDEAKVALKYRTDLTIAEVATQSGYQDSNYFCTVFKKAMGCSPSDYRKAWGEQRKQ